MFYEGGMFMGGMHWLWWFFWVGMVGALFYGVWGSGTGRRRETPQEVLQRRLADGDITPDEYEQRKALLDRDSGRKV